MFDETRITESSEAVKLYICFLFKLRLQGWRPLNTVQQFLQMSIGGWKFVWVPGNAEIWLAKAAKTISVTMLYSKLWKHSSSCSSRRRRRILLVRPYIFIYIYIYIYIHILLFFHIYIYIYTNIEDIFIDFVILPHFFQPKHFHPEIADIPLIGVWTLGQFVGFVRWCFTYL